MREIDNIPPFGVCLRRARRAMGRRSASDVARRAGMNVSTVCRIERGERPNVPWARAWSILVDGDLPLEEFFPPEMILRSAGRIRDARRGP